MDISDKVDQVRSKLEQVRSKLSDEQATSLGGTLKEIEGAVQDLGSGHIAANREAKNRKIEIRQLNEKLENIEIERDDYKTKYDSFDTSDLKKQIEEANKKITNMVSQQKDSFIKFYENTKEHPNWEKASKRFKIPMNGDTPDWDSLDNESLEKNIEIRNDLQELEYFTPITVKGGPEGGKSSPGHTPEINEIMEKRDKGDMTWKEDYENLKKKRGY